MFSKFGIFYSDNLENILRFLDSHQEQAMPLAGGTDIVPRLQNREIIPKYLVDLSRIKELKGISKKGKKIRIGALTTVTEIKESIILGNRCDLFNVVGGEFGSPSIRNIATVGGNLGVALSSSDFIPALTALGAKAEATSLDGSRETLVEDLIIGKREIALKGNEIIFNILFDDLDEYSYCSFEKFRRRNALDVVLVSCCVYIKMSETKDRVKETRVVFNRLQGKVPECCRKIEDFWRGRFFNEKSFQESVEILDSELRLTSDYRASKEYRTGLAKVLFKKAFLKNIKEIQKPSKRSM